MIRKLWKIMTFKHTDIRVHREVTLPINKIRLIQNKKSKSDNMQIYSKNTIDPGTILAELKSKKIFQMMIFNIHLEHIVKTFHQRNKSNKSFFSWTIN